MSGWKTSVALLLLGVGLGVWVWWDLRNQPALPEDVAAYPLVRNFPDGAVYRIELDRPAADRRERIVFEKKDKAWRLAEPEEAACDPIIPLRIIDNACANWAGEMLAHGGDLERFGLGAGCIRAKLYHPKGSATLLVGRTSAVKNSVYAMVEGSEYVGVMDEGFERPFTMTLERIKDAPKKGSEREGTEGSKKANVPAPDELKPAEE